MTDRAPRPEGMSGLRLAAIAKRVKQASDGPWIVVEDDEDVRVIIEDMVFGEAVIAQIEQDAEDGPFIAHARQDIPDLLAEVSRLRADGATLAAERDSALGDAAENAGLLGDYARAVWPQDGDGGPQTHHQAIAYARTLSARAEAAEADGAMLRERVKKLPSPLSWHAADSDGEGCEAHIHCAWCGHNTPADSSRRDSLHHGTCLWGELASAPKEPTP